MVQTKDLGQSSWSGANTACKSSRVGGFTDWRLPTRAELQIMYENKSTIGGFRSAGYWSVDYRDNYNSYYLSFNTGTIDYASDGNLLYIRAVRTITK
ncbi:MAG: DUF1566 domain-containing protein [Bacteroidaceae bacterium]|nr:DUF1566 domain-containing protein [Bacteroidaceae bacterium]